MAVEWLNHVWCFEEISASMVVLNIDMRSEGCLLDSGKLPVLGCIYFSEDIARMAVLFLIVAVFAFLP